MNKKFNQFVEGSFPAVALILFLLLSAFSSSAEEISDDKFTPDGKGGFMLTISGDELFENRHLSGNFQEGTLGTQVLHYLSKDGLSLNFEIYCSGNKTENKEIGFNIAYTGKNSYFIMTSNNDFFVESLEIEWANLGVKANGALSVFGRTEINYNNNFSSISRDNDEQKFLSPDQERSFYRFAQPIRYIAFINASVVDFNSFPDALVAFKSFTIHFVKDAPSPTPDLSIGNPDIEVFDVRWANSGSINIPDFIVPSEGVDTDAYKFFLKPNFTPNSTKPSYEGEIPNGWTSQQWRLFNIFETESLQYDGYWPDDKEKIECTVKNNDITLYPPCSGRYILYAVDSQGNLASNEAVLNIWSDIDNTYNLSQYEEDGSETDPVYRFGINYIGLEASDPTVMNYPYDPNWNDQPLSYKWNAVIHIPGLYDAEILYRITPTTTPENPITPEAIHTISRSSDSTEGWESYSYDGTLDGGNSFNLENLKENTPLMVELKVKKNGAETPVTEDNKSATHFTMFLQGQYNDPLGIADPEAGIEDTVEYFDLNGNRVRRELIGPGIYIRRTPTSVSKVLL